jgi:LysM repeat protein
MKTRLLTLLILITLLLAGFSFPRDVQASSTFCHYVKRGENVTQIAQRYGVTVSAIQQANNLWNPNLIYVGQCLRIPTAGTTPPSTCGQVHIVRRGEYVKVIAARYGVSVTAIVQANGLRNPNIIYVGQRLKIPCTTAPPPQPPPAGCVKVHVVQRGEYLKVIAARYGVSVTSLVRANGIRNPNLIYPGQRLKIPVTCPSPPKPTPKPPVPTGPWKGQYWGNRFLSGTPKYTRNSNLVDFNWGTTGPGGGIGGTDFSARFTRTRHFDAGRYRFNVKTDDGVRVWVDGILIIDEWHDTPPQHYSAERQLSAGNHSLQIDYYQNKGGAQIKFWPDQLDAPVSWKGVYFNNVDLSGNPVVTRYYQAVDFNWGNKSPVAGITADYFSARFTGEFHFTGGKYRFSATVDDGIRIYLDDEEILNDWRLGSSRTVVVDKDVSQGTHKIKVEYFENTGDAVCKVRWTQR